MIISELDMAGQPVRIGDLIVITMPHSFIIVKVA